MAVTNVDIHESSAGNSDSGSDEKHLGSLKNDMSEVLPTASSHVERDWSDDEENKIRRK